jgi:hypothetical protein
VTVSGGGITVSGVTVVSATQVTATFTITAGASASVRNVSITTPGGTSNTVPYTVLGPSLVSIAPVLGARGSNSLLLDFLGNYLTGATGLTGLGGGGITVVTGSFTVVSASEVRVLVNISPTATLGFVNIGLVTPIGNTNTVPFTIVNPAAPTLTGITPNSGTHPASGSVVVPVTLTGTNFTATGTTMAVAGSPGNGITVSGVTVTSSTSITANFTISSTAALGPANVTVTTPGNQTTGAVTFTVN